MSVYNVYRMNGEWVRQIVASSLSDARRWVDAYLPGCIVRFAYPLN